MTSINAIKFNHYQGAMVCDEQRGWNEESMIFMTADKIKPVTEPEIEKKFRFVASYGNTGTSSIGDELKFKIRQAVSGKYKEQLKLKGNQVDFLMTIEELANLAFSIQIDLKHRHIDETMKGRYGFTARDFLKGSYTKAGKQIDIKQEEVVNKVHGDMIWKGRTGEMTVVFLNAGIIAGYEPKDGFRIFQLSLIEYLCQPVQEIFLNDGSGRDVSMIHMTEYTNNLSVPERQGDIDPVEGLYSMISSVNAATRFNLGVGGYFNLILFDGKAKDPSKIRREIAGHDAKLAMHISQGTYTGVIPDKTGKSLLEELCFGESEFEDVYDKMMKNARSSKEMSRLIRGYKLN